MEMVLGMPFLSLSNADVKFAKLRKLTWRSYTAAAALSTTSQMKFISKREFAKAAMDENFETFVMHMSALEVAKLLIHLSRVAQIAALQWDKASIKILAEYSYYAYVFSLELAMELPENTGLNEQAIKLIDGKQSPYGPIYTLSLVELETLKAYIKTHLKTGFIRLSKSLVGAPILIDKKPDGNLCLCVDYWSLNNLTIKNWYPFPLIKVALDCLGWAKQFTQLDLTSAYHQRKIREGDK